MCIGAGEAAAEAAETKAMCDEALAQAWNTWSQAARIDLTDEEFLQQKKAREIEGFLEYAKAELESHVKEGGEEHLLWQEEEETSKRLKISE